MEREDLRLECVRIAVSKTADHNDAMVRAKGYFDFITENKTQVIDEGADSKKATPKNADKVKILS